MVTSFMHDDCDANTLFHGRSKVLRVATYLLAGSSPHADSLSQKSREEEEKTLYRLVFVIGSLVARQDQKRKVLDPPCFRSGGGCENQIYWFCCTLPCYFPRS